MNVTILSKDDDELRVEVAGQDHTLLNVLKDALLRLDQVEAATYDVNPEQSGSKTDPVLYVKTGEGDPIDAIQSAVETVEADATSFRDDFEDALAA